MELFGEGVKDPDGPRPPAINTNGKATASGQLPPSAGPPSPRARRHDRRRPRQAATGQSCTASLVMGSTAAGLRR